MLNENITTESESSLEHEDRNEADENKFNLELDEFVLSNVSLNDKEESKIELDSDQLL